MPLIAIMNRVLNHSISASIHQPLLGGNSQHNNNNNDVHRANFVWFEDDGDAGGKRGLGTSTQ